MPKSSAHTPELSNERKSRAFCQPPWTRSMPPIPKRFELFFLVYSDCKKLETADLETLHPSRSQALTAPLTMETHQRPRSAAKTSSRPRPPIVTKEEKAAIAAKCEQEKEQARQEREKKVKRRERMKKNFQKMTKRGQPVMKPRLEHLLSKVKKIMKQD